MATVIVDTNALEVAAQAAAFGGRQDRLNLYNVARVLNGGEPVDEVTALTHLGNPERAARAAALDELAGSEEPV